MVVTIWNEFRHEKEMEEAKALYPNGIHACIAEFLKAPDIEIQLASLDEPDAGLPPEVLERTDVLLWWGHMAHHLVPDDVVRRVVDRVQRGMGFIPLHSAHKSRPFMALTGCTGNLSWGDNAFTRVFCANPSHPIAKGIPEHFDLGEEEMYTEPIDIPQPNELIFANWYRSGYLFRSGFVIKRGRGTIFYFQPGHETCGAYHHPVVQQIIKNAVRFVAPDHVIPEMGCPQVADLEPAAK